MTDGFKSALESTVEEGEQRLRRSMFMLLATGAVGGIDVGMGVFALLFDQEGHEQRAAGRPGLLNPFIALTLANSELFTENFLVPIAAVAGGRARVRAVLRLWAGTLVMNLVGGWIITLVVVKALPSLGPTAIQTGQHFVQLGFGWQAFAGGVLAGTLITLMTWGERGTESVPAKLVAAIAAAFLLGAASLNHAIVLSLDMLAGLHAGAPFGYVDWLKAFGFAAFANMVGGIGLVATLRVAQAVGQRKGDDAQTEGGS